MLNARLGMAALLGIFSVPASAEPSDADVIWEAVSRIEAQYVEPVDRKALLEATLAAIKAETISSKTLPKACKPPETMPEDRMKWRAAIQDVLACELKGTKEKTIAVPVLGRLMAVWDKEGSYIGAEEMLRLQQDTSSNVGAIGVSIMDGDDGIEIVRVATVSPLKQFDVKGGDLILAVDGTATKGTGLDRAIELIRGKPGTSVTLKLLRKSAKTPQDIVVTRKMIDSNEFQTATRGNVTILTFATMYQGLSGQLTQAVSRGNATSKAFVIDLRGNGGGLLDQVAACADVFLENGPVMSIGDNRSKVATDQYFARKGDAAKGKPLVILVDRMTASGAEMLTAALQDNGRALIVGEKTFGRNSIQTLLPLSDRSALRLTTARVKRPNEQLNLRDGIIPDRVLKLEGEGKLTEQAALDEAVRIAEELTTPLEPKSSRPKSRRKDQAKR